MYFILRLQFYSFIFIKVYIKKFYNFIWNFVQKYLKNFFSGNFKGIFWIFWNKISINTLIKNSHELQQFSRNISLDSSIYYSHLAFVSRGFSYLIIPRTNIDRAKKLSKINCHRSRILRISTMHKWNDTIGFILVDATCVWFTRCITLV